MSKENNVIFRVLQVIAWLVFIGLCIEAGAILVNFVFSIFKPKLVHNLYNQLDLSNVYRKSKLAFFWMYGFVLLVSFGKALLFYLVIELVQKLDLTKPFSRFTEYKITQISVFTFLIGLISFIAQQTANKLAMGEYEINNLTPYWVDSKAFLLMSGILYIIATIFKKGVDLQNENDLTV